MAMNDVLMMRRALWRKPQSLGRPPNYLSSRPKQASVVGFKCVSKSSPISCHPNQNNALLVKSQVKKEDTGVFETRFSLLKYPFTAADADEANRDESCLAGPPFEKCTIHGHSHGIVCFSSTDSNDLFLYNPLTRELRKLPPSILIFPGNFFQGVCSYTKGVGFGYDHKSRDLKVVRIVQFFAHSLDDSRPSRAEVYDLRKDRWREVRTYIPSHPSQLSCFDLYYEGCYYWWATNFHTAVILSFDFADEVFKDISMPEGLCYPKTFTTLSVFNESVVLFNYPWCCGDEKSFDVWKMVKHPDHDQGRKVVSWTKLFTMGPLLGILDPLAFVSSDELLMVGEEGQLMLCNIFNNRYCKPLPIKGDPMFFKAVLFHKTALSVKGGGHS